MNNRAKSIPYPPRFKDTSAPREFTREHSREHPKKYSKEFPRKYRRDEGCIGPIPDVRRMERPKENPEEHPREHPKLSFMDTFDYLTVPEVEACMEPGTPGLEYPLKSTWVFWVVKVEGQDPIPIYRFSTIGGFWYLFNRIDFDRDMRCMLMRMSATPRWECESHKNGAYWIISFDENDEHPEVNYKECYVDCLMAMIGENLFMEIDRNSTITGITCICGPKLRQIRYWLSDRSSPPVPAQLTPDYRVTIEEHAKFYNFLTFNNLKGKPHRGGKKFRARRTDS